MVDGFRDASLRVGAREIGRVFTWTPDDLRWLTDQNFQEIRGFLVSRPTAGPGDGPSVQPAPSHGHA